MTLETQTISRRLQCAPVDDAEDGRLHRRFELALSGRFMRADKTEHACRIKDISVGGVALTINFPDGRGLPIGERVVAYVDQLGGLEGEVVRTWNGGFAFKLNATQYKREKLASQITWLLNEQDLNGAAARQHERVTVGNRSAQLVITGGVEVPCLLLDVSVSGASIACKARPDIDSEVHLGRFRARVVRHHAAGIGLQFMELLDVEILQLYFSR